MIRPILLVPVCALLAMAWISGCRPAAQKPPDATPPVERALRGDGGLVTSLTYDSRIFFDSDEDHPRPQAGPVLDALALRLRRAHPTPHVAVLGHTDAIGSDAFNLDLSRRRARSVMQALVQRGIDPRTLQAIAVGKRQPVASDDSAEGRAQNRRVEFLISPSANAIAAVLRARPSTVQRLRENRPAALHVQVRTPDPLERAPLGTPVPY